MTPGASPRPLLRLLAFALAALSALPSGALAEVLGVAELEALAALREGRATLQQRALLFSRNDAVNRAALGGYIPDDMYQAAQSDFARINANFAKDSAEEVGAAFRVQTASSATYSPGTDSDYITVVDSPDQIRGMQQRYNERVNQFLELNDVPAGRSDWHVQLDTDFMADPARVTDEQFREIAKLNNDAYTRRAAAEFEAVSRAADGTLVSPEQYSAYAQEMRDFVAKKQKYLAEMRANPALAADPAFQAEFHKIMAQEQKYISRIEAANSLLREQRGLPPVQTLDDATRWSVTKGDDGMWHMIRESSLAKRASRRAAENFLDAASANAVARNSFENATERLAQSMLEASRRDPDFAARAMSDVAELLSDFPPARKGDFLAEVVRTQGHVRGRELAEAMRSQQRAAVKSGAKGVRAWAGRMLKALEVAGIAWDLYESGAALKEYVEALHAASDPSLTDAEAAALFDRAEAASHKLVLTGGLGALMEAYPPVAAAMGSFAISFYGTRAVLENTETGQVIDLAVTDFFDSTMQASESAVCSAREFLGYESECERLEAVKQGVLESILKGVREGRYTLKDGKTMRDVIAATRAGRINLRGDIIEESEEYRAGREQAAELNRALERLRVRCAPAEGASAPPAAGETLERCARAGADMDRLAADARSIRALSARALTGLDRARTDLAACAGPGEMDRAFAAAQTASTEAAQAARAFRRLEVEGDNVRARAETARAAAGEETGDARCEADLEALMDRSAALRGQYAWPTLQRRFEAVETRAGALVRTRSGLADCRKLMEGDDPVISALGAILDLADVPGKRERVEAAARACRDRLDRAAETAAAVPPAGVASAGAEAGAEPSANDPEKLRSCLCACNRGKTNFSCGYDETDKGWSPSCRDLSNGPCICKAFGCFRAQPVTSGPCAEECRRKYGEGQ